MTKRTKITHNMKGLEDFLRQMGGDKVTRVGVLGGDNSREGGDGMGNADIGAVHEFGSESAGIPPRSFLRMPLELKAEDIIKVLGSGMAKKAFEEGDFDRAYNVLGAAAEITVQDAFATGGFGQWPAIKESTAKRKGSSAILIDTRQLSRSISWDVVKKSEV